MILEETLLLIYPITLKIKIKLHFMSLKPMKIFQFLFFLLLTNISYSQVEITGYIEESGSGERLPYSNVYLVDLESGASANENGFLISNSTSFTISLIISLIICLSASSLSCFRSLLLCILTILEITGIS